jgi:hypothetical protein
MENEFLKYEESLALKELGFDEKCLASFYTYADENFVLNKYDYRGKFNINYSEDDDYIINTNKKYYISAPLYQQAFRWFREKYNLEYQIIKSANGNYSAVIHLNTQEYLDKISTLHHACVDEVVDCYSHEEAELACLKKLIEIVKNNE